MNQNSDSSFLHFPAPAGTAAPDPAESAKRGRPNGYAPKVIDMLCASIRQLGLSDSAAAEQQGMSTSTLSRWKQLHPEVGIKLKQARQEIRAFHLQRIFEQSAAENGKGWRASVWILERLFPGDYSPRMKDRLEYLDLENRVHDKEVHEALNEKLRELHEMQAEERAAQAAGPVVATGLWPAPGSGDEPGGGESGCAEDGEVQTAHRAAATTSGAREMRFYSEDASHNCRNSPEASMVEVASDTPHPQQAAAATKRQQAAAVQGGCAAEESDSTFDGASHNCRNSPEASTVEVAVDTPHPQQAAAATKRQQAAAVQGGCAAEKSASTFDGVSHYSRNWESHSLVAVARGEGQPLDAFPR